MDSGFEHLLSEGVISEVIARLKSGKEADVYAVRYGGRVVAAKVYKERAHRSFKNNSAYKEGRTVRNSRSQRAMDRKTSFGQAAAEAAWKSAEADALYKLHAADVRVPTPVMFLDGVLLMELVLDAHGDAAPRLIDVQISPAEANAAYRDMLRQLVRILSCDLIHGDLSPYNVLWGAAGPTIIDFPQIISASHNSSSEAFFLRDARNILGHFAGIDPSLNARRGDPWEIWRAYVRRELTPDFLPVGRTPGQMQAPRARPSHAGDSPRLHDAPRAARPMTNGAPHAPGQPHAHPHARAHAQGHGQGRPRQDRHLGDVPRPAGQRGGGPPRHDAPRHDAGRGAPRRAVHVPEVIVRVNRSVPPPAGDASNRSPSPAPLPQALEGAPSPNSPPGQRLPLARNEGGEMPAGPSRRRRRRRRH
jgi:RIO kinase 1